MCTFGELAEPVAFPRAGFRCGVLAVTRPELRLLEETTGEEWTPPLPLSGRATRMEWSPEGTRLLSVNDNGTARLWDAITGLPLGEELVKRGAGGWVPALYPDGEHIALPNSDGSVKRWTVQDGRALSERLRPRRHVDQAAPKPGVRTRRGRVGTETPNTICWISRPVSTGISRLLGGAALKVMWPPSVPMGPRSPPRPDSARSEEIYIFDSATAQPISPRLYLGHEAASLTFSPMVSGWR